MEGRGSAFAVDLPLWAGGRADPTTAGPAAPGGAVALVAAESADGRDLLAGVLRHAGFDRVERAAGLAEAERALRDLRPALAVLESDLGDGYASDVLRGLERRGHRLPVIVVTDLPDPDDERRLQEAGAWAVLATPLDVPRLAALAEQARAVQSAG